jgi:putative tryptophan/tyrosine transport system substrate-binding protein
MTKNALAVALCVTAVIVSTSLAPEAQPSEKLPRLGWLQTSPPTNSYYKAFYEGLRDLGYAEGKNIDIVARSANGQLDRLPELARELVGLKIDALFTGADQGLRAAKEATNTIPIVVVVCDSLDSFVASIARPGGKATGLTCISSELAGKRLQMFKELVPGVSRVAVLYNPEDHNKVSELDQMQTAAQKMGLALRALEARSVDEIDKAFVAMGDDHTQAVVILSDALMVIQEKRLAELALKNRIPAMFGFREFADAGGLVSYGASLHDIYRRAASYVDKVLKGTDPGDLPIEQPTRFELVLNLKTAKALGLDVPPSLLAIADEVIE